jgi:uracil-DNA glycosylase family 4
VSFQQQSQLPVINNILSPQSCPPNCPMASIEEGFLQPEGTCRNGVLLIGEAAGEREVAEGLPFRPSGEAGAVLMRAIKRAGLERSDFGLTNIIQARPPLNRLENMPYEEGASRSCRVHLNKVIDYFKPKVLLALGGVPLKSLTGMRGKHKTISSLRGFPLWSDEFGLDVVASFHPAFISRGAKQLYPVLIRDLLYGLEVAKHGVKKDEKKYVEKPTVQDAWNFYTFMADVPSNRNTPIAYDIETLYSLKDSDEAEELDPAATDWDTITQIQFSPDPYAAICFPYRGEYVEIAKKIMALPNPKWGHNSRVFDEPILRRNGFEVNGERHDTMNAFHHIQPDLPKNLQFVASLYCPEVLPWKHLSQEQPEYYGCIDADVVQRIGVKLFPQLKQQGIYEVHDLEGNPCGGYLNHVQRLTTEVLDPMQRRGMPVDVERQRELRTFIEGRMKELDGEIQGLVPEEIRQYHPKDGFVRPPKEVEDAKKAWADYYGFNLEELCWPNEDLETWITRKTNLVQKKFKAQIQDYVEFECVECLGRGEVAGKKNWKKCPSCKGAKVQRSKSGKVEVELVRWCQPLPFLVNGPHGLLRYMKIKGHKIPIDRKTKRPTTDDEALAKLYKSTKDRMYWLAREYRKMDKAASTYIWELDSKGFVHTTFTTNPASGQLSSVRPNIQNIPSPKHEEGTTKQELAKKIRATVRAKAGFKIVNFDYSGFHIITLGVLSGSPNLVRLARIDAHSFITAHVLKLPNRNNLLPLSDEELKFELSKIKKEHYSTRNAKVKPCIAEGQLVLTKKRGLVPVENISLDDKVWDGVEWVSHQGIICRGEKEVITYEGLTATPDHIVYTAEGPIPFGQAASEMVRLIQTGFDGKAIRVGEGYQSENNQERGKGAPVHEGSMYVLQEEERDLSQPSSKRRYEGMRLMQPEEVYSLNYSGQAFRRNSIPLQQPQESRLQVLRGPRNQMSLQIKGEVHTLGREESTPQRLQGSRDRPNRQRRPLRAGESTSSFSSATGRQQAKYCQSFLQGGDDSTLSIPISLRQKLDSPLDKGQRNDRRGDNRQRNLRRLQSSEGLAEDRKTSQRVRVYDILNAGPRHRFTVSGVLVHNCLLGINLGMKPNKLYEELNKNGESVKVTLTECVNLQKTIFDLFPEIPKYQAEQRRLAHSTPGCTLTSPWGYLRRFWEVYRWDVRRTEWVPGDSFNDAAAFGVQALAHGRIKEALLEIEEKGYGERFGIFNMCHDSIMANCREEFVGECIEVVKPLMERPSMIYKHPTAAPDGLWCGVEVSVGQDWLDMTEVK